MTSFDTSFSKIIHHSNLYIEMIVDEGINIEERHANELNAIFDENFSNPFGLLINFENPYSFSFRGGANLGRTELLKKIALLAERDMTAITLQTFILFQREKHPERDIMLFNSREHAIAWLENL